MNIYNIIKKKLNPLTQLGFKFKHKQINDEHMITCRKKDLLINIEIYDIENAVAAVNVKILGNKYNGNMKNLNYKNMNSLKVFSEKEESCQFLDEVLSIYCDFILLNIDEIISLVI